MPPPPITADLLRQSMSKEDAEKALAAARRLLYQQQPLEYMVRRLGIPRETLDWSVHPEYNNHRWDGTLNPLVSVMEGLARNEWVGVESATGTGKTYMAACLLLWFLECFPGSLVVTTAPKEKQLKMGLWRELEDLHSRWGGVGELQELHLKMSPPGTEWSAIGLVAGVRAGEVSATKMHGFHARHMLILCEETPGIPDAVMTALQNTSQAEHNLILAFGNPDYQLDALHQFCSQPNVRHIRISALDHPNVVLGKEVVPGAVTRQGIDRLLARYGSEENPLYLSRARGICPSQGAESLIRLEWCWEAARRWEEWKTANQEEPVSLGVDVANSEGGDKAAVAQGRGVVLVSVEAFACPDSNQLGHKLAIRMRQEGISQELVGVDGVGVGAGAINVLKEYDIHVETFTGGVVEMPGPENFNSLRSQMWWQMREDLRMGIIAVPQDEQLFSELVTPKWEIRLGKICVEQKHEIRKRLGRSPDKADAAVYWNWIRARRGGVPVFKSSPDEKEFADVIRYYHTQRRSKYL